MLEAARDVSYCSFTDLAYASKLPYMHAKPYSWILIDTGLIIGKRRSNRPYDTMIDYNITAKGTRYLSLWYEMRKNLSLPDTLD
jgi:predicted transcriptional regulator